ncbi:MAG: hypothetical protein LDL44_01855 [Caenispirillum sp.]|nr:hypothetical protein [Caenispirillum sp.]
MDDLWAWDPLGGIGLPSSLSQEDLKRQHAAAREQERHLAALVPSLYTTAQNGVVPFAESCAVPDVAVAVQDAFEALAESQEQTSANPPLVGREFSFIRLQWDCLTIWEHAAAEDLRRGQVDDFKVFSGLIYEAATGISLDEDAPEASKPGFIQMQGRQPVSTDMEASRTKAHRAKTEMRGSRIVAVAHPGSTGRLISFGSGMDFGSPVGWRKKKAAKETAEST